MTWKLRLTTIMEGKTNTIKVEADTRAAARAIYEADWSRFNHLDKIEMAATKPEIIEAILADMARYRPRADAEKEYGGFLRGLPKNELEGILEARLS